MNQGIRYFCLTGICSLLWSAPFHDATASDSDDLKALVEQAKRNFPDPGWSDTGPATEGGTCGISLQLDGSRVYRCHWKFAYRDTAATKAFAAKDQILQTGSGAKAQAPQDQQVNHPDSYDLRTYQAGNVRLTASIKDKAALQETYVFLAVYGVTSD